MIVVSASGMATGGRVLHHLRRRLPDPSATVVLAGFQAAGTRGRALRDGATEVRIHGELVPVRARIASIDGLSAHGDRDDLLRWARGFGTPPRHITERLVPGGHIGLFMGSRTLAEAWPEIGRWIVANGGARR